MNKKLVSLMFASLLLGGVSTTFVGCKDYDDDINNLNTKTDGLNSELTSLKTALDEAKAAAETANTAAKQALDNAKAADDAAKAAQAAGDAAAAEAEKANKAAAAAMAEAEAAKAAAETAKAEAIAEAIAQCEKLINAVKEESAAGDAANAAEIAKLAGQIEAIEASLNNIDLSDINKQLGDLAESIKENAKADAALKTQVEALEGFKANMDAMLPQFQALGTDVADLKTRMQNAEAAINELKALKTQVGTISSDLAALTQKVNANGTQAGANATEIAKINTEIGKINTELGKVSEKISTAISNFANTLAALMNGRLTSVTLQPDLYVGGIPTIAFESARYNNLVWDKDAKDWVRNTKGQYEWIVSNGATVANYRLNPATLKNEDIKINDLEYVTRIASTRAGDEQNTVVKVAKATIDAAGSLIVNLTKNNTHSLNLTSDASRIYTVSLKVPIADKHLFDGEGTASVYSEYTRVMEAYFEPELRFVPGQNEDTNDHLTDSLTLYKSGVNQEIDKRIVYNEDYDLYKLVEGCKVFDSKDIAAANNHQPLTRAQLNAYGFDIVFGKPTTPYLAQTTDRTNQQDFFKLSGENNSILTPCAPGATGYNQASIGKEPIIRAMLVDTKNKNIIEVSYLKVQFSAMKMEPIKFELTVPATGKPCTGASYDFTWKYMTENVFVSSEWGQNGISKEEFWRRYQYVNDIDPVNPTNGTIIVNVIPGTPPVDATPVMTWSLTPEQLALYNKLAVNKLVVGNNECEVTKTVTFRDNRRLYPDVIFKLTMKVTTPVEKPTLGATDPLKWQNNTMLVYPVPMKVPYDNAKASYKTNILEGRTKAYVNGLLGCDIWNIQLQKSTPYQGERLSTDITLDNQGVVTANPGAISWNLTPADASKTSTLDAVYYVINHDNAGVALVESAATVPVDWMSSINGEARNRYTFATTDLKIVPILKLQTTTPNGFNDNSHVQTLSIYENFRLTDAYGNLVAKVAPADSPLAADYWKYYGVEDPQFSNNMVVSDDTEGKVNPRSLASLNMTADVNVTTGVLTFQNAGAPLQANAYLVVPVTVKHWWGTLSGKIAVPLKHVLRQ